MLREAKKQAISLRILREARKLFLERGVAATTVEDIAAAADISRASLFNYYRGKPAILDAMAAAMAARLQQLVEHYRGKPLGTPQRLQQLFAHCARVLEQTGEFHRELFLHDGSCLDSPGLYQALKTLLHAGQQQGDVRQDLDLGLAAELVHLSFSAGLLGWLGNPRQTTTEQFAARARFLASIFAPLRL